MYRVLHLIVLLTATNALGDPLSDLCEGAPSAEIQVGTAEFTLVRLDLREQVVDFRAPRSVIFGQHQTAQIRLANHPMRFPATPAQMARLVSAYHAKTLTMVMNVRNVEPTSPLAKRTCAEIVPYRVALKDADELLAERQLDQPLPKPARKDLGIRVGNILVAKPLPKKNDTLLRAQSQQLAEVCVERLFPPEHSPIGSLSIELFKNTHGQATAPQVVVDGVVNPPLRHCLLRQLADDRVVWEQLTAGTRLSVTFYFSGPSPSSPSSTRTLLTDWKAP